jgi:hypothetical protein
LPDLHQVSVSPEHEAVEHLDDIPRAVADVLSSLGVDPRS